MRYLTLSLLSLSALLIATVNGCGSDDCTKTLTCEPQSSGGAGATGGDGGTTSQGAGSSQGGGGSSAANGEACGSPDECASGSCVDAVCCESDCVDLCMGCAVAGSEGSCVAQALDTDPDDECAQAVCDGQGACSYGVYDWSTSVDLAGVDGGAVDKSGNAFLLSDSDDLFLTRISSSGTQSWSNSWGGSGNQYGRAVAALPGGSAILTGYSVGGAIDFGGPSLTVAETECVVAVISSGGNGVWAQGFNSTGNVSGHGVAGNATTVALVGHVSGSGTVSFGGGDHTSTGTDAFWATFNAATGTYTDSDLLDASVNAAIGGVAINENGEMAIAGRFTGTMMVGTTMLTSTPSDEYDLFVAKIDSSGSYVWARSIAADLPNDLYPLRWVDIDAGGAVLVSGTFDGTIDFGGGAVSSTDRDAYVAALESADGSTQWSTTFGAAGTDTARAMFDQQGYVLVAGSVTDEADLGGGPMTAGPNDVLVAKLDASGNHLWSRLYGDSNGQGATFIGGDSAGDVFFGGSNGGTFSLGGPDLSSVDGTTFVARFGP